MLGLKACVFKVGKDDGPTSLDDLVCGTLFCGAAVGSWPTSLKFDSASGRQEEGGGEEKTVKALQEPWLLGPVTSLISFRPPSSYSLPSLV